MSRPFLHKHIAFSTLTHYVLQCYCYGKILSFFQQLHYAQKEMMITKLDCIFKAACTNNNVVGSLSFYRKQRVHACVEYWQQLKGA